MPLSTRIRTKQTLKERPRSLRCASQGETTADSKYETEQQVLGPTQPHVSQVKVRPYDGQRLISLAITFHYEKGVQPFEVSRLWALSTDRIGTVPTDPCGSSPGPVRGAGH